MGCAAEWREQKTGLVKFKVKQQREKVKKMTRAPGPCGMIAKLLTFLSWKFWEEWGQGRSGKVLKGMMAEHFPNSVK